MGAKGSKLLALDRDDHGSATNPAPKGQPASSASPDPNPPVGGHDQNDSTADALAASNPQADTPHIPSRCVRKVIRLLDRLHDSCRKHYALMDRYFQLRNRHLDQLANAPFDPRECSYLWGLWEETNNALEELYGVMDQYEKDLKAFAYCSEIKIKGIMRHRAVRPRWKETWALITLTHETLQRHKPLKSSHADDQNRGRVEDSGMDEDVNYWSRMLRALRSRMVGRLRPIF